MKSSKERIKSFKEFYPFYLSQHQEKGTKITHVVGTSAFILFAILGLIVFQWQLVLFGVLTAYGFAWVGHFFIEKNKPATFQYPLWSLLSDFKMLFDIARGKVKMEG